MTLGQITTSQAVEQPRAWHAALLPMVLDSIDGNPLNTFSAAFQRVFHLTCLQDEELHNGLPVFVLTVLDRTVGTDDPLYESRDQRVSLLAETVATAAFGMWTVGDDTLQTDPGRESVRALGAVASEDQDIVLDVLDSVDRRLADRDVPEWFREQADSDASTLPLRDRVLGIALDAATEALEDDETNRPVETLAADLTLAGELSLTTRLYRAGLQAIRDGEGKTAKQALRAAWLRGRDAEFGTRPHEHAAAAGVGYAAHLALEEDPETDTEEITEDMGEAEAALTEAPSVLLAVVRDEELPRDPEGLADEVDTDVEPLDVSDLEALAYAKLASIDDVTPTEYYTSALRGVAQGDPETAVRGFATAWDKRDAAESESETSAATAAGIGLLAHVELDVIDEDIADLGHLDRLVANHREDLSEAVLGVYDAIAGDGPDVDSGKLTAGIDPESDEFDAKQLETMVFASLLASVDDQADPRVDDDEAGASVETRGSNSGEEKSSASEEYVAGLQAVVEREAEDAVRAFVSALDAADEDGDARGAADGVAAGVALLAHVELGMLDVDIVDRAALVEGVTRTRDELSSPVLAVYDAIEDGKSAVDPETLTVGIDADAEPAELDRGEMEALAFADLLGGIAESAGAVSQKETYTYALQQICAIISEENGGEKRVETILSALDRVWNERQEVDPESDTFVICLRAGVGVAAYLTLLAEGDEATQEREEIIDSVVDHRDRLTEPADALFEHLTTGESDTDIEELLDGVNPDGEELSLDELEAVAYAGLLGGLQSDEVHLAGGDETVDRESDDEVGESIPDDRVLEPLVEGLEHVVDEQPMRAVEPLLDAWDASMQATGPSERYGLIAGVALAVVAQDNRALATIHDEIVPELTERRSEIPAVVRPAFEGLEGEVADVAKADIRNQAADLPVHGDLVGEATVTMFEAVTDS